MIRSADRINTNQKSIWLIFAGDRLVSYKEQIGAIQQHWNELSFVHHYSEELILIGEHKGLQCYAIDVGQEQLHLVDHDTVSMRAVFMHQDKELFELVARAWQLVHFRRTHRFCGQCGSAMQQVDWEMAVQCHRCSHRCYPRVSPCIIVSIRKDDKILLAQGKSQRERKMFSTLAGFVESGEDLEQAVHREVFEEVEVKIKNVEYFGSQPWPFPHSLMMGFMAEHESGEIKVDGREILEAHWFDIDDLPYFPPNMSIAGKLIDETIRRIKFEKG